MDRRRPRSIPFPPLVLVVDDHEDTRELYVPVQDLVAFGFDAIAEADYEQAYRRAQDCHPDIVVTDLTLGGGDGWQLRHDLKREARTPRDSGCPADWPPRTIVARTRRAGGLCRLLREAMLTRRTCDRTSARAREDHRP